MNQRSSGAVRRHADLLHIATGLALPILGQSKSQTGNLCLCGPRCPDGDTRTDFGLRQEWASCRHRDKTAIGGRGTEQQQVRIAGEGPRLISGTTGNAALSSGFDDDRCIDRGGNHVSDRRVEIDVSFRRTDGDDQAVPGGKVVAFLSGACAPPTL